jgi:uncharacterized membrane protein YphA (DoxX/SURF4 family)
MCTKGACVQYLMKADSAPVVYFISHALRFFGGLLFFVGFARRSYGVGTQIVMIVMIY